MFVQQQKIPNKIIKRDGRVVPYSSEKILEAIRKAFLETNVDIKEEELHAIVQKVEERLAGQKEVQVERVQDLVELALMESDYFLVAKAYILYRETRRQKRLHRETILRYFTELPSLQEVLEKIEEDYPEEVYDLAILERKYLSFHKENSTLDARLQGLIRAAIELTEVEAPKWEYIAGRLFGLSYSHELEANWNELELLVANSRSYQEMTFAQRIKQMEQLDLYGHDVLKNYSEEELNEAATYIQADRDYLLTYSAYELLTQRYVIRSHQGKALESIQEMFLGISLFLAIPEEGSQRLQWAKRFYDMLSQLHVTMATPTLANARKKHHQLSSCFIDTVDDSLNGIYRSITNFARVSKFGGGMGLYFGKVRAQGSPIRGFEGAAGGVIRWIRLANDTAVAVDQLGVRQGAVACYLDVWHKDLPEFLDLRTNNGDDRMKAHDIFPGVCYPDYFWQEVDQNMEGQWALLCPYEVKKIKGYALEDFYGEAWKEHYLDCVEDARISKRWIPIKEIVRMIIKSLVETGTPFTFNRDAVNRANPNQHKGMIYCSNLCTEIAQNMEEAKEVSEEILDENGDSIIVSKVRPGSFVVCNLASINLGAAPVHDDGTFYYLVTSVVRALDNVISLNQYPVPDAKVNNERYRPIGLGVSGYHHLLAKEGIRWESEEHLTYVDQLFEKLNYFTIQASVAIAKEKGSYAYFENSAWQDGNYFALRNYVSEDWKALQNEVKEHGMRNGYLLAIAPTSSTSIVAATTPGIDPIMNRFFYDEKKNGLIPRVAPDLNRENYWLYKSAHTIDQHWSIRAAASRQRHIDQATSTNLYITNDYSFRDILGLYLEASKLGIKTIYYVRSKSLEIEECESCAL